MSNSPNTAAVPSSVRKRSFQVFEDNTARPMPAGRHWLMRSQNFIVQRVACDGPARPFTVQSPHELLLILPETGAAVQPADTNVKLVAAPAHALCILPAGRYDITLDGAGDCCVLASARPDLNTNDIINAAAYADPDPRIAPVGTPYRRLTRQGEILVMPIDDIPHPRDNQRLKFVQTDTMSINWVEYSGPRTRTELSPHSHTDLEQGSLALMGNYVHHLRVEWGRNADLWQDDEHLSAPAPSLLVVPVNLIHTTEGVGDDRHILVDVFAPPRQDFIAKGWMCNSSEYERVPA